MSSYSNTETSLAISTLYIIYVYHEGSERLLLAALGFYKVCGRSCTGKCCGDHLICLRKGSRGLVVPRAGFALFYSTPKR